MPTATQLLSGVFSVPWPGVQLPTQSLLKNNNIPVMQLHKVIDTKNGDTKDYCKDLQKMLMHAEMHMVNSAFLLEGQMLATFT